MKKYFMLTVATMMTSVVFTGSVNASNQSEASSYEKKLRTCIQLTNHPTPSNIPTAIKLGCQTLLQKEMLRKQAEETWKNKFSQSKFNATYTGDNKDEKK